MGFAFCLHACLHICQSLWKRDTSHEDNVAVESHGATFLNLDATIIAFPNDLLGSLAPEA